MSRLRVLIVDDQREVRNTLAAGILTLNSEFEVIQIPSGEEALLEASRRPIDLLVADVRLPGISGLELMQRIRKRNPDLKIILVTGIEDPKIRRQVADAGADAFFYKPIEMADFLDAVERCLGLVETIFPMPPIAEEAEPSEQPVLTLGERLVELRQDLNAIAVALVDHQGQIVAQAGDLYNLANIPDLLGQITEVLSASAKISHTLGAQIPDNLLCLSGSQHNLWVLQVGLQHLLLIVTRDTFQPGHLVKIGQLVVPAAQDIQHMLGALAVAPVAEAAPAPEAASPEAPPLEEIEPLPPEQLPALDDLFGQQTLSELTPEALDAFWDSAVDEHANQNTSADTLTYEQAQKLGLAPGEGKNH